MSQEKTKNRLQFNRITWKDKETSYIVAYCPELDLYSHGQTKDDALGALHEAINLWLDYYLKNGILAKELAKRKIFFEDNKVTFTIEDDQGVECAT